MKNFEVWEFNFEMNFFVKNYEVIRDSIFFDNFYITLNVYCRCTVVNLHPCAHDSRIFLAMSFEMLSVIWSIDLLSSLAEVIGLFSL